jgi:hypothetical protein
MTLEQALQILGYGGAFIAFAIGLAQYSRAQEWKRAEFLADEIKDMSSDTKASCAITMIDWAARRIRLLALRDTTDTTVTVVTYGLQCQALLPHTLVTGSADEEVNLVTGPDGTKVRRFTPEQAVIRDCYDALLDRWDRMGAYLERRLMKVIDMTPYVGYYINDIASPASNPREALWMISLFTYIWFYHFTGVVALFKAFGHDIRPGSRIFVGCMKEVEDKGTAEEKAFARSLQEKASAEARRFELRLSA